MPKPSRSPSGLVVPTAMSRRRAAIAFLVLIVFTVVVLLLALMSLGGPEAMGRAWFASSDNHGTYVGIRASMRGGWFTPMPGLNGGSDYITWIDLSGYSHVAASLLSQVLDDPILVGNIVLLAGFATTALAFTWVARSFGVLWTTSLVLAAVFALLPQHFFRLQHGFAADYANVALLTGGLLLLIASTSARGSAAPQWRSRSTGNALLMLFVGAFGPGQYVFLWAIAIAVPLSAGFALTRSFGAMRRVVVSLAIVAVGAFLQVAFHMFRNWPHTRSSLGTVNISFETLTGQSMKFSGLPMTMLLPYPITSEFTRLRQFWDAFLTTGGFLTDNPHDLGASRELTFSSSVLWEGIAFVSLSFVVVMAITVALVLHRQWAGQAAVQDELVMNRLRDIRMMLFTISLFWVAGGLGLIVNMSPSLSFRAWGRLSMFIVFLCLLAAGLVVGSRLPSVRAVRLALSVSITVAAILVAEVATTTFSSFTTHRAEELSTIKAFMEVSQDSRCERTFLFPETSMFQFPIAQRDPLVSPHIRSNDLAWPYVFSESGTFSWTPSAIVNGDTEPMMLSDAFGYAREQGYCSVLSVGLVPEALVPPTLSEIAAWAGNSGFTQCAVDPNIGYGRWEVGGC